MYKIGIVGWGYVGKGIHRLFKEKIVAVFDPFVEQRAVESFMVKEEIKNNETPLSLNNKKSFKKLDLVVLCVMTRENNDRSCDISIIKESIEWLIKLNPNILILVKSAVTPKNIEDVRNKYNNIKLVISPEYLGEGNQFVPFWKYPDPKEMKYHDFQIFGGDKKNTSKCIDIFQQVMGPHTRYYQTDLKTSALVKYMENSWLAYKVTFCNEWYDITKAYNIDYNELRELWLADGRVEKSHTVVFPKKRGYGGKCLPKDTRAIIKEVSDVGYKPEIMTKMDRLNSKFNKLNSKKIKRKKRK